MPQILEFECPLCHARLRSKDRTLVGREIPCPECRAPIRIVDRNDGRIEAEAIAAPIPAPARGGGRWAVRVAVTSTILLCCGLLFFVLREKKPGSAGPVAPVPTPPVVDTGTPPMPAPMNGVEGGEPQADPVAVQRLRQLGGWLEEDRVQSGAWPLPFEEGEALAPEERFSWLARLAQRHVSDGTPPPNLSLAWNAPENDRFVRRRIAPFQNPDLAAAGPDRYPAGHFVGIAGVGPDAPRLAKSHPRAGIWGYERRTTVDDVRDGLSNTFLVLGREQQLHSWGDGVHSMRGVTAEPYFGGPDGFGTGQPDGMHALLADGSVKFLAKETAPVVIRRYAAMADGFSLDPSVSGDPLDLKPSAAPVTPAPVGVASQEKPASPEDEKPILPQFAVDLPRVDLDKALSQPLKGYRIEKPVPIEEVLFELRELMAVPLDWSAFPPTAGGTPDSPLARTMTVTLEGTTVGGVLEVVAEQLRAEIVRERLGIRLVPRPQSGGEPAPAVAPKPASAAETPPGPANP